jgi:deazaflavin-dependent oxidoreductase (nitroreductase family)
VVRWLGHKTWFIRAVRVLPPADRLVARLTRGRVVALGLAPSLLLTTTGRRTGQPRSAPLVYATEGDGYLVIGSNWGQPSHPAWVLNLLADPDAVVLLRGRSIPVRARQLTGAERERAWQLALRVWPAYDTYARRAGREIMVFRLEPRQGSVKIS